METKETRPVRQRNVIQFKNEVTELIHPLDLFENRVFWMVAGQYSEKDKGRSVYRIPWECFPKLGYTQLNTKAKIEKVLGGLLVKRMITRISKRELHFTYISLFEVVVGKYVEIHLSEGSRSLLDATIQRGMFCSGMLDCFLSMPTVYASRLYLMLTPLRYKGSKPMEVTITELKQTLFADGKVLYDRFGLLKQKILDPAKKAFSKYSDFDFTVKGIKVGRKIEKVSFEVEIKERYQTRITDAINKIMREKNIPFSEIGTGAIPTKNVGGVYQADGLEWYKDRTFYRIVDGKTRFGGLSQDTVTFLGLSKEFNIKMRDIEKAISAGVIFLENPDEQEQENEVIKPEF